MPLWLFLVFYGSLLGIFYFLSSYLEKTAAMRGTHRNPLPSWVDKSIRLFFLCILVSPLWWAHPLIFIPLTVLYTPSYIDNGEKTGKRVSPWLKQASIFRLARWYFGLEIVADWQMKPDVQYVLGVHPHGFLPVGTMINLLSSLCGIEKVLGKNQLRTLAASFCFYVPIYRDIILGGGVIDAARYNARRALTNGYSLALVPGGATEALYAGPGRNTLVLRKRKGFIRLAIETGAHLVPVYSFGENDCYSQMASVFPFMRKVQAKFQSVFGLSLPIVTNIIPRRVKITTVFGQPIPVTRNENPSEAEIDALLEVYIKALTEHFNKHAPTYIKNPKHRVLEIL